MPNPVPRGIKLTNKNMHLKPHSNSRKFIRARYLAKHTPFIPNPEPLNRVKALHNYRESRRALKQSNGSERNSRRNALNNAFSKRQTSNGRLRISTSPKHNNNLLNEMDPIRGPVHSEYNPIFYKASNGRAGVKLG
jgi:hypothetical protein